MSSEVGKFIKNEKNMKNRLTPENIALKFMAWKKERLGVQVYYFKDSKRSASKAWIYFDKLSEKFKYWKEIGFSFDIYSYFDKHLKYIGKGENLEPSQLVTKYSYKLTFGRYKEEKTLELVKLDFDKQLEGLKKFTKCSVFKDHEDCLINMKNYDKKFVKEYIKRTYNIDYDEDVIEYWLKKVPFGYQD